jgi:hypothetical protein
MPSAQPEPTTHLLISTEDLSEFLGCDDRLALDFMRRLEIPKRGSGFPRARLLAALGFPAPIPMNTPEIWKPLLDAPAAALATEQSAKTIGRMYIGDHRDKSFTNYIHVGERKRLIFQFEAEAWLEGEEPKFSRQIEFMHSSLRAPSKQPKVNTRRKPPSPQTTAGMASAALFMPPKRAE